MDEQTRLRSLTDPDAAPIPLDDAGAERFADLVAFPDTAAGPWVRTVFNRSLDGAVVGEDGISRSLSTAEDRFVFSCLRTLADVILVGAATARAEDYSRVGGRRSLRAARAVRGQSDLPAVAVMTRSGDVPAGIGAQNRLLLLVPPDRLEAVRAEVGLPAEDVVPAAGVAEAVARLAERGLRRIQLEGGPTLLGTALAEGVVDELCLTTSFTTVGGTARRMAEGAWHHRSWRQDLLLAGPSAMFGTWRRA